MKKNAIPDFSRKRPTAGATPPATGEKTVAPNPRQAQKPPAKARGGGRRGT
jgi:hypothetical protein